MADNAPTTPATKGGTVSPLDVAIGLSLLDAVGDGGEVVGRRNSPFYNNTYDILGLPRNRFSLIQNTQQQQNPFFGQDLRDILGGNAEVHGQPNSNFSFAMMSMLAGQGIFGLLLGMMAVAQQDLERQSQPAARPATGQAAGPGGQDGPPSVGPAAATGSATGGRVASAAGDRADDMGTITIAGEEGEAPRVVAAASPARATVATATTATRTSPAASTTRVASGSSSAEPAAATTRTQMMPASTADTDVMKCEAPKPSAPAKLCTITIPPKGPGGR